MLKKAAIASALALSWATVPALAADKPPAALIIAQGGLGDGSWNDTANAGFKAGLEKTGIEGRPIESKDVAAQGEEIMRRAADGGFGLVISLEWIHGEPMEKIAKDYADTNWVIMNQTREGDNVASVVFAEHEGSYLAGALAALATTDTSIPGINPEPVIGVIGGVKAPGIDKFIVGYIQGAKAINPDIDVKVAYSESFGDPAKGQQMAQAMFDEGADIVYQVAGGTGIGIIEAAKQAGKYAIGVDTDQDGMAPGNVLTSMVKRVDVAVEDILANYAAGTFPGGEVMDFGLVQNGVGLSDMKHTKDKIPADYLKKVDELKAGIIAGDIEVWDVSTQGYPDFFK
ncbi:BMP family lipoprotein [Hoeflea prorocentri]|uniref:BMP family ABC transporter substrate-binding protein n=1 Tax=Hoeflea prorocentri TaxID=1922333 RepID=A0A9X3UGA8_9HYPH|nr:BMP family ABC transporter substrate-binding protein [Hoeflea prorocentri]MCY6380197.1 BMP family ABC transporter substrate-binding protein [Hoeflea prorocentri]MDA5397997.1 BMP family ABC transporter substrate-binding protein [Hoeflea prorocentri]